MSNTEQQLRQAADLIRQQRLYEARQILNLVTGMEPNNADAWWLLANAQTDPAAIRDALNIVLRLQPDNQKARQRLDALNQQVPGALNDLPGRQAAASSIPGVPGVASLDDLLSNTAAGAPGAANYPVGLNVASVEARRRRSPCLTCLLTLVIISLCLCLGGVAVIAGGVAIVSQNPTLMAGVNTVTALLNVPDTLPTDAVDAGAISAGEPRTLSIGEAPNVFTYTASAGETVAIATQVQGGQNASLPLLLGIYTAQGKKLANSSILDFSNIDVNGNRGTQKGTTAPTLGILRYTFKDAGTYQILVKNWFSSTVPFRISVDRR
jgi:hypothetical protein